MLGIHQQYGEACFQDHTGFQYTSVLSMASCVTWLDRSQSHSSSGSRVTVPNRLDLLLCCFRLIGSEQTGRDASLVDIKSTTMCIDDAHDASPLSHSKHGCKKMNNSPSRAHPPKRKQQSSKISYGHRYGHNVPGHLWNIMSRSGFYK